MNYTWITTSTCPHRSQKGRCANSVKLDHQLYIEVLSKTDQLTLRIHTTTEAGPYELAIEDHVLNERHIR